MNSADATTRDYELFAALAGVRGVGPQPKGVPKGVSSIVNKAVNLWKSDGHSHSWSSLKDFEKAFKRSILKYDDAEEVLSKFDAATPVAFNTIANSEWFSYPNLIAYCKKQVELKTMELESEKHLLGVKGSTKVRCRLVYFFDS